MIVASYGSLARFRDERRLFTAGQFTCIAGSGDISDLQHIQHLISQLLEDDYCVEDGHQYSPEHVYEYLSRVMYSRRSRVDPLWNSLICGGVRNGKRFLGVVDLHGTTWQSTTVATGFGAYLAQPLLRKAVEGREDQLSEQEAIKIIQDSMRVLFYRDARSLNKVSNISLSLSYCYY
jgi:20S proteasome subunit beta 7